MRFAYLNQSKIGAKKWVNQLVYGNYRDLCDENENNDSSSTHGSTSSSSSNNSSKTSTRSNSNNDENDDDDDGEFEQIKPTTSSGPHRHHHHTAQTNTEDCFVMAINSSQKYFLLFNFKSSDDGSSYLNLNYSSTGRKEKLSSGSLEKSLGLEERYSTEQENLIMLNLSNWLDKITEGFCPSKHTIKEWPNFN